MPKRKYERKSKPYKRSKKRKRRKYRAIPKGLFGKTVKQKFRYCDTITVDPGIGSGITYHTFRANSLYDPDLTGTGHTPFMWPEYQQFYNHYTVLSAKIKATFQRSGIGADDTQGNFYCGVFESAGPTPDQTDITTVLEQRDNRYKVAPVTYNQTKSVTKAVSISKFLGQKVLQEDANAGTLTTNPAEQVYFQVWAATNNEGVSNPAPVRVLIEIEYIAVLHEPKVIAGSG